MAVYDPTSKEWELVEARKSDALDDAVHLDADGVVVGVTAANNPREVRAGMALIKARARPDVGKLEDAGVGLQTFVPK